MMAVARYQKRAPRNLKVLSRQAIQRSVEIEWLIPLVGQSQSSPCWGPALETEMLQKNLPPQEELPKLPGYNVPPPVAAETMVHLSMPARSPALSSLASLFLRALI